MKILIVSNSNLEILSKYDADAPSQQSYGGPWGRQEETTHVACPEELDHECVKAEMQDDVMVVLEDVEKASDKLNKNREEKLRQLRIQRESKLAKVDQLVNIALLDAWSAADKAELKAYRQALLDMTEVYKADMSLIDALDLANVEFPIEPSAE